jgi:hypothetical protein
MDGETVRTERRKQTDDSREMKAKRFDFISLLSSVCFGLSALCYALSHIQLNDMGPGLSFPGPNCQGGSKGGISQNSGASRYGGEWKFNRKLPFAAVPGRPAVPGKPAVIAPPAPPVSVAR